MLGRTIDLRLRKLEGARRRGVFFLVWGRSAAEVAERLSASKAAGLIAAGDLVVKATWDGQNGSPPCRWIAEREWPCEHSETLWRIVERVAANGCGAAPAPGSPAERRLSGMSDARLVAVALGARFIVLEDYPAVPSRSQPRPQPGWCRVSGEATAP